MNCTRYCTSTSIKLDYQKRSLNRRAESCCILSKKICRGIFYRYGTYVPKIPPSYRPRTRIHHATKRAQSASQGRHVGLELRAWSDRWLPSRYRSRVLRVQQWVGFLSPLDWAPWVRKYFRRLATPPLVEKDVRFWATALCVPLHLQLITRGEGYRRRLYVLRLLLVAHLVLLSAALVESRRRKYGEAQP